MASEDVEMKSVEETQLETEEKKEVVDEITAAVNGRILSTTDGGREC